MSEEVNLILSEVLRAKKQNNGVLRSDTIELMCFNLACEEFQKVSEICSKYSLTAQIKQKGSCIDFLSSQESENCLIVVDDVKEIEMWTEVALRLGYLNCACTTFIGQRVAEGWKNKIFAYDVSMDSLELESCNYTIILYSALALYISKKAPSLYSASLMAKAQF